MARAGIRADSTAPANRSQASITSAGLIRFPPRDRTYLTGSYSWLGAIGNGEGSEYVSQSDSVLQSVYT